MHSDDCPKHKNDIFYIKNAKGRNILQVVQYKCPNCGGDVIYSAETRSFHCEYCDSNFSFDEITDIFKKNENLDLSDKQKQEEYSDFAENNALYQCPSCGSQIIADKNTVSLNCYYCHSPVTLTGRLSGEFRPDYIIPFSVTREQAEKTFLDFCKDKKYLPKDFNDSKTLEKITGVYVPFWLGDYSFKTDVTAFCKSSTLRKGKTLVREYNAVRGAVIYYENIPADGARLIDDTLMDALQPYDFSKLTDFSMSYLSGFMAEKYDVDADTALERQRVKAMAACKNYMETDLKRQYDKYVNINTCDVQQQFFSKKYALLPVWFLAYHYNGKVYQYGVNGQTGKLSGSIPINRGKLNRNTFLYGLAAAGVLTVLYIIARLLGFFS